MLTDTQNADVINKFIRQLCGTVDRVVYGVMAFLFDVFFNVASQDILKGETVKALIGRLQLIVGIVFIFILAIHIVQGIVNPDLFTDSNNGTSKVITKIIISLFLISAMIPLNVSGEDHSWNKYMGDQGILFGTMSYFQYQVLHSNVLGKLILGADNTTTFGEDDASSSNTVTNGITTDTQNVDSENEEVPSIGNFTATGIAKLFVFPNMDEEATNMKDEDQIKNHAICHKDPNFYCDPDDSEHGNSEGSCEGVGRYQWYSVENQADRIFGYVDNECTVDWSVFGWATGEGQGWQFRYLTILSTAVGIFVILMLLKFTADIAIRVFKLVVLRILGPIAAISYAAPGENKMFSSWTSSLANAYLEIFLDLSIIYFVILVMTSVFNGDLALGGIFDSGTFIGIVTIIFLIIGLLMFAKSAPGYIRQILGLPESTSKGFFSNLLGGIGTLAGLGLGAAGVAGGAIAGFAGSAKAARENGAGIFRQGLSGVTGSIGGMFRAGRAAIGAENNMQRRQAAMDAVQQRNAMRLAQARADVSSMDRLKNRWRSFIGGEPVSQALQANVDDMQTNLDLMKESLAQKTAKKDSMKAIKDYATDKAVTSQDTVGQIKLGGKVYEGGYRDIYAQMQAIKANGGRGNIKFNNGTLSYRTVAKYFDSDFTKSAIGDYIANDGYGDAGMANLQNAARNEGFSNTQVRSADEIGKAVGNLQSEITADQKTIRESEERISAAQRQVKRESTVDSFNQK